ncbi:MAG: hypothetical protein VYB40_06855 [Candidatus Thermoplasmatota archaeon]|nr:hypothetical protein [Candidatus Thermoplasmatota archaeon]
MALLWQTSHDLLTELVQTGVSHAPFPPPPHLFEGIPVIEPSPETIAQQAITVDALDKAGFKRIIVTHLELKRPDYVRRAIDEERALNRYILESQESLADHFLKERITEWLQSGLDEIAPDSDRWFWGMALFTGACLLRPSCIQEDGFHLLESIALGRPPGRWQTKAASGPHYLDWDGSQNQEEDVAVHVDGAIAAAWLLDIVDSIKEGSPLPKSWWIEIVNRSYLYVPLRMGERIESGLEKRGWSAILIQIVPHLLRTDTSRAEMIVNKILADGNEKERINIASLAERIVSESIKIGLRIIDFSLKNEGDAAVIATSALPVLAHHDPLAFMMRAMMASQHRDPRVRRRFVDSGLRMAMQIDPIDEKGILLNLIKMNDDASRVRVERFANEMAEINPSAGAKLVKQLAENGIEFRLSE